MNHNDPATGIIFHILKDNVIALIIFYNNPVATNRESILCFYCRGSILCIYCS